MHLQLLNDLAIARKQKWLPWDRSMQWLSLMVSLPKYIPRTFELSNVVTCITQFINFVSSLIIVPLHLKYHHRCKILFIQTIRFVLFCCKETSEKIVPWWNGILLQSYSHFMLVKSFYLFPYLTDFAANAQFLGKRTCIVAHYTWKD